MTGYSKATLFELKQKKLNAHRALEAAREERQRERNRAKQALAAAELEEKKRQQDIAEEKMRLDMQAAHRAREEVAVAKKKEQEKRDAIHKAAREKVRSYNSLCIKLNSRDVISDMPVCACSHCVAPRSNE